MSKRKKIIIGLILIALTIGLALLLNRASDKKEGGLVERPGLPKEEWWRTISIEERDGFKVIRNEVDGYEITVPVTWDTETEISWGSGHHIAYTDNNGDLSLRIFSVGGIDQAKDYFPGHVRFETIKNVENITIYRTSNKMTEDRFDSKAGDIIEAPIENSLSIGFIFPADKKTYIVFCNVLGDGYEELASQCEKQVIDTFTIID